MRIVLLDSDSTKFYNLTIEDINGIEGMFLTKYVSTQSWLDDKDKAYEGSITTKHIDALTNEFPPDGGGEAENTSVSNYSINYPENCDGWVNQTTTFVEYSCGCGHWPGDGSCKGCTTNEPEWAGYAYATTYECIPYYDGGDDPNNPGDTSNPNTGGGVDDPEENEGISIGATILPVDCTEIQTEDPNLPCYVSPYDVCLLSNSPEVCDCLFSDNVDDSLCYEFGEILEEIPNARFDKFEELKDLLAVNPWTLIQDCAEQNGLDTSNYFELYDQTIPQECSDRLFDLGVEYHHQSITDGNVPLANIDYYSVEVTSMPDFNNDGSPDSEAEMYQAFRNNFIDLASGEVEDFQLSCNLPFNPTNTADMSWEFIPLTDQDGIDFVSNNPITSILTIEAFASGLGFLAADDGAVMVSGFTDNDWTISTISTANNGTQPFSGNRQWGWLMNQNGNFEFFTRAIDVANISILLNIFSPADTECQQDSYYNVAEATWQNMQQEIAQWVNDNGGQATIIPHIAVRVDREKIEELLTSNDSIGEILSNCN